MAQTEAEVRASITGGVFVAPVGTPSPGAPSLENPLPSIWTELGYISDDGITRSESVDKTDHFAFQNNKLVRTTTGEVYETYSFTTIQENKFNIELIKNGKIDPTDGGIDVIPGQSTAMAWCFVILDGDDMLIHYLSRGFIDEVGDEVFSAGELRGQELTVKGSGHRELRSAFVGA